MNVVILGAGQVGGSLAEHLANASNDITVVDHNGARLRELADRLDIRTIQGRASLPNILSSAGADDADLLIAVTNSDEINMIACQIAWTHFRVPKLIARVRDQAYNYDGGKLFNHNKEEGDGGIPIDVLISPELLVTQHIASMIHHPGSLQVIDFANGAAQLVAIKASYGGPLVDKKIALLRAHMPNVDARVAAIFRQDSPIIPTGDTEIKANDEVFFIAAKNDIRTVMSELRRLEKPYKRIMIAGGGNIGFRLAESIETQYQVKIIERGLERCNSLARDLNKTIVLHGNATDSELLLEENIDDIDVFCALTNDDEANIMASMLAKRLGAKKVITLINNAAYVDLIQGGVIDIAISPQLTTIGTLLTHVRRGDIVAVHALRRGVAEAIEAIAHGTPETSRVVGRKIEDIQLPSGTTIGAIVREDEVLIAHDDTIIEDDDHVILFLADNRQISAIEKLFTVNMGYF